MILALFLSIFLGELILLWINKQLALCLLLVSISFVPSLLRCKIGVPFSLTDLTLLAIGICSIKEIIKNKIYPQIYRFFIIYWLYILLTSLISSFTYDSGEYVKSMVYFTMTSILVGILLSNFKITDKGLKLFGRIFLLTYLVIGFYGIFNYLVGFNPYIILVNMLAGADDMTEAFQNEARGFIQGRISSTFIHPLELGQYTVITFSYLLFSRLKINKIVKTLILLLMIIMILLCGSRSAMIPLFFVLALYIYSNLKKKIVYILPAILIVFIAFSLMGKDNKSTIQGFLFFWNEDYAANAGIKGSQNSERFAKFDNALYMVRDNILFGRGQGFIRYHGHDYPEMAGYESLVLQTIVDGGVFGLIVYLLFYISLYRFMIKRAEDTLSKIRCHSFCLAYLMNIFFTGMQGVIFIVFILFYFVTLAEMKLLSPIRKRNNFIGVK